MLRTHYIGELRQPLGGSVRITGWVERVKEVGRLRFIWIRDKTGISQVTVSKENKDLFEKTADLRLHDFMLVTGKLAEKPIARVGVEIIPTEV